MKVLNISKSCLGYTNVFCVDICKQNCAISRYQDKKGLQIMFLKGEHEYCFNVFQAKVLNNEEFKPYLFQNECLQIAFLTPKGGCEEKPVTLTLDSAAQVSVMSLSFLEQNFPEIKPELPKNKVRLIAADGKNMTFLGAVRFRVQINSKIQWISFFIIKEGNILLLGLPDLIKLKICINFDNLKNQGNLFLKVQKIEEEK